MMQSEDAQSPTQLLRGTISNYRRTRCTHDFMFTQADRNRMGATAIAAGLTGLGGIAAGLSGMAMDTTEEADLLEFDLGDKHIRAWVWLSVFKDGDEVEVVAEPLSDVWQGYGIRRVIDKVVSLHPHCSRGIRAHYIASAKWLVKIYAIIYAIMLALGFAMMLFRHDYEWSSFMNLMIFGGLGGLVMYSIIAFNVARKFKPLIHLAEGIFTTFGWKDVKNIDLPAITKKNKKPGDPGALGILYFRY